MRKSPLFVGLLLAVLSTPGFAAGKKVRAPPKVEPASVPAPLRAPEPSPPPAPVVSEASPPPAATTEELVPLPALSPRAGLLLEAAGGVIIPFQVLGVGGRGEVRASWLLAQAPLGFSLSVGFEQHTAKTSAFIAPPAGGLDPAALDNQTLYPVQLLAHLLLLRDERNRLQLGAGYAALITWSQTQALGSTREESGLGHEVAGELAYARRFGSVELEVRARYSVRRTAVGRSTTAMELAWYQTAGLLLGLGLWP